ncbi:MAG: helix-turn-helix transcriptional regulator [Bacteroidetes bacterium]|nr:helix-turn-helix transcriptional regulator [Bacteroidota bacterium]
MEQINEYMHISLNPNADIKSSFCNTTQNEAYVNLVFGLFANDCLFDIANNNYEFRIRIAKGYFEKYNESLDINIHHQSICCNTQSKLLDLVNCSLTGLPRKIFIESAILFLLYQAHKNNLLFQFNCDSCAMMNKATDVEKIQLAKKYILDNLSSNLTIPKIASNVGTNQCYLKKGFKDIYNQTIFDFVQENRMQKAKHLLQGVNPNITSIAMDVGYSSLSSFSQAYKNYFGISPTDHFRVIISKN